jgi:hypothetical protein
VRGRIVHDRVHVERRRRPVQLVEWFPPRRNGAPLIETAPRNADETLLALDAAIRRRGYDALGGQNLHALVLAYCDHARDEHLTPEHMLVRLKHALDGALVAVTSDPLRRDEMRASIVKLAIDAYYDDGPR